jgi:hypothetical protein
MKILIFILISSTLISCGNYFENSIRKTNERLIASKDAYLYKKTTTEQANIYRQEWRGKIGKSAAFTTFEKQLVEDIFISFKKGCGFNREDLVETRIISHKNPVFHEVWVFKDPLSKRKDKTSGLSVILTSTPKRGGTDIALIGQCHQFDTTFINAK